MKIRFILLVLIVAICHAMGGCATCERHPYVCAVGGALVVGSVAATVALHNDHHDQTQTELNPAQRPYLK